MDCALQEDFSGEYNPIVKFHHNDDDVNLSFQISIASVLLVNLFLYFIYLILRLKRKKTSLLLKSDKPFTLFMMILATFLWIVGLLFETQQLYSFCPSFMICSIQRYWIFFFGFHLWIICILHRLIRMYQLMVAIKSPWPSWFSWIFYLIPIILFNTLACVFHASFAVDSSVLVSSSKSLFEEENPPYFVWCTENKYWTVSSDIYTSLIYLTFLILSMSVWEFAKNSFPDLKRSIIFGMLSFLCYYGHKTLVYLDLMQSAWTKRALVGLVVLTISLYFWITLIPLIGHNIRCIRGITHTKERRESTDTKASRDIESNSSQKSTSTIQQIRRWFTSAFLNEFPVTRSIDDVFVNPRLSVKDPPTDTFDDFMQHLPNGFEKVEIFTPNEEIPVTRTDIEKAFESLEKVGKDVETIANFGDV